MIKLIRDKTKSIILKLVREYSTDSKRDDSRIFHVSDDNVKKMMLEVTEKIGINDEGEGIPLTLIQEGDVIIRLINNGSQIEILRISNIKIYNVLNIQCNQCNQGNQGNVEN